MSNYDRSFSSRDEEMTLADVVELLSMASRLHPTAKIRCLRPEEQGPEDAGGGEYMQVSGVYLYDDDGNTLYISIF